jgi:heat shock protein HslJ
MSKISAGLLVAAIAFTVAGCAPGAFTTELRGEWVLTAGTDSGGALDTSITDVTLVIDADGASGRVCNSYGGTITGTNADLRVESIYSTEMWCETSQGIMDLEQRFLADLGAVTSGTVGSDTLVLTGPDITLEFTAAG